MRAIIWEFLSAKDNKMIIMLRHKMTSYFAKSKFFKVIFLILLFFHNFSDYTFIFPTYDQIVDTNRKRLNI